MKKLYFILSLLLLHCGLFAQKSFKEYGYATQTLRGSDGSYTYYFRVLPNQQIDGSTLSLSVSVPRTLNMAKSFVHVFVNDEPSYSSRFKPDTINKLIIPLTYNKNAKAPFLKLTVKSQLFIGNTPYQEENNPSLWLNILPQSNITWAADQSYGLASVNLSNTTFSKTAIVYPNNISSGELQAVALTYAKLRRSGQRNIKLYAQDAVPSGLSDFIYIGLLHKLKPAYRTMISAKIKSGDGLLYIHKGLIGQSEQNVEQILFMTAIDALGLSKALDAVLTPGILSANFQNQLIIKTSGYKPFEKDDKLFLSDLDDNANQEPGGGSNSHDFNFKTSAFAHIPADLNMELHVKYTGIGKNDRGYFNVYLNNTLITSRQLNESGSLRVAASVNRYQIKKFNTLRTEFVYNTANGLRTGTVSNFVGQVDVKSSFLDVGSNLNEKQISFYSYPDVFQQNAAILVSKDALSSSISAIADLAYQLNDHYSNEVTYRPIIDFSNNANKYTGKNVILLTTRKDSLLTELTHIPLQYSKGFTIYGDNNNEIMYQLSSPDQSTIAQIFEDGRFPAVLSITIPNDGFSKAALQQTVTDMSEQLNQFSGNILISNKKNHQIFNLAQNSNNIKYSGDENGPWISFWTRYKLLFLAGVLFMVFLGYIYVRTKVKHSQTIVNT
ncbi:hypothetical protein EZ449_13640 [Pedobacter frigidisoli]|uniref:Cellulose synthase subunit n=1 Tax=Pedobacter frigidisoli TaxID=2530455 RepID=A0A4R0NYQ9_9SPHI|nr:cellulose biosynthesis cyclic di-GMP-binding regulatory protein BcsB [Pedobacter frigidisoli]TCD07580.1 hypothetical protein EZ449_13640 [Pedobacter frigidisoli]